MKSQPNLYRKKAYYQREYLVDWMNENNIDFTKLYITENDIICPKTGKEAKCCDQDNICFGDGTDAWCC